MVSFKEALEREGEIPLMSGLEITEREVIKEFSKGTLTKNMVKSIMEGKRKRGINVDALEKKLMKVARGKK